MSTEQQHGDVQEGVQAEAIEQLEDVGQTEELVWITQTLAGDTAAFACLFERYKGVVYTHVFYRLNNPLDAQDAVQEIFQRAYLKLHTFDTSRRFRAWLLTIATNYCTDMLRRRLSLKRFVQAVSLDVVDYWLADHESNPEQLTQSRAGRDTVRQVVGKLPDKYRELVVLFYWNELSYSEIAEISGLKESTVKTRLHRARGQLIALLEETRNEGGE